MRFSFAKATENRGGGDFETIRRRFSLNAQAMADEGDYEKDDLRLTTKRWIVWWQVGLTNKGKDEKGEWETVRL